MIHENYLKYFMKIIENISMKITENISMKIIENIS